MVKAEKALKIAREIQADETNEIITALKTLANLHSIKKKLTSYPNNINQDNVNNFFMGVDENGVQEDFKMIQILKVREVFKTSFVGEFEIPVFPAISEEMRKNRQSAN